MPISLHLPPSTEAKLIALAAAAGIETETYLLEILDAHLAIEPASLRSILGPIHDGIRESGILTAKLDTLLAHELSAVRSERCRT